MKLWDIKILGPLKRKLVYQMLLWCEADVTRLDQ